MVTILFKNLIIFFFFKLKVLNFTDFTHRKNSRENSKDTHSQYKQSTDKITTRPKKIVDIAK